MDGRQGRTKEPHESAKTYRRHQILSIATGRTDGLNVTAMTWRGPPIALGQELASGTELDGKRIGGHGQGGCTLR
jgi:hypothetical protein